ncbi:TlpA family protein disulfide reductase [Saccharobesus litoralis]|uniref:TlpA family protein disulfide reductase n=1 Tax=Saccharobesus litoralis TaxID=2172099 RepID=UPI00131F3A47|nr:TlpA disulfide reductase family protein [Saccharobesus litoralis]
MLNKLKNLSKLGAIVIFCLVGSAQAKQAPPINLPSLTHGQLTSLAQFKGKIVYLDFWASWCGPCKKSFPFMQELQQKYQDKGVEVVAISVDEVKDDAETFLKQQQADFTLLHDQNGKAASAFNVMAMPTSFLINSDGKIVATHLGFKSKTKDKIVKQINALVRQ